MIAWAIAVSLLLSVLGFEFLLFRYVGSTASASTADQETARRGEAVGATDGAARSAGPTMDTRASPDFSDDEPVLLCPQCDAPNEDAATIWFCSHCLSRLR